MILVKLLTLVALVAGMIALFLKLFWPKAGHVPDASDNWAQHNELRSPSLEKAPEAGDTEIDAAVLFQIVGD